MRKTSVAIALFLAQSFSAQATDADCMNSYYRTKSPACIDAVISSIRDAPSSPKSDPSTLIGFLSQIFLTSPGERQRILAHEQSEYLRGIYLQAVFRTGLQAEAENYARENRMMPGLRNLEAIRPAPLEEVRPASAPADNDLLIGAYMASGNPVFIERILDNLASADDGLAKDGLRMGLLQYKFGPQFVPKGREPVVMTAACEKYQCKANPANIYRLLTLTTAVWAMQALSKDEGVNKTVAGFFERNDRLKKLLAAERTALGNYVIAVGLVMTLRSDHASTEADQTYAAMSKAASTYETLGSASDAFAPIEGLIKSGSKPK